VETITDDQMRAMLVTARGYTVIILRKGPNYGMDGGEAIIWEHGRRNFALRADGRLAIVCPVNDGSDVAGVGLFIVEAHAGRSFPGDALP
jgi:hypothetical protein